MISDDLLRRDVRFLGDMLGQVISNRFVWQPASGVLASRRPNTS
jgi:hypothetical protein